MARSDRGATSLACTRSTSHVGVFRRDVAAGEQAGVTIGECVYLVSARG